VAIPDPRAPERPLLTVQAANRGLSVSGQVPGPAGLVLDPRSGRPVAGDVLAAVAIADSAADADALSTALVASGYHRAADLLGRMRQVEAILLVRGETAPRLLASGTLADRLELSAELAAEIEGEVRYLLPPRP
jgi:thiamine biosynthesis lipoprotein ApbE